MLSGIPFERRLRPRQLPGLPESPPPVQPSLLAGWSATAAAPYDFALEHRVLFPPEQPKEPRPAAMTDAKAVEAAAARAAKAEATPNGRNGYLPQAQPTRAVPVFQLSRDPLKPQQVVVAAAAAAAVPTSGAPLSGKYLRDFERVEDPFDDAELNTIDVMAELKSVLGAGTSVGCAVDISEDSTSCCGGGGAGFSDRPSLPSISEITFPKLSLGLADSLPSPTTADADKTPSASPSPPPSQPPPQPPPQSAQSAYPPVSQPPVSLPPPPSASLSSVIHLGSAAIGSISGGGGVRSSSYPDLLATRPQPPPPPPPPRAPSPSSAAAAMAAAAPAITGPDPYRELGPLERIKVDGLLAMGFRRDRAARAVARLGIADDDLLAFLCSADRVADGCGVSPEEAEAAIRMLGSEAKAVKYLKLKSELLQFGFSPEDIQEAALAASLDRDKTIAALMTRHGLSLT